MELFYRHYSTNFYELVAIYHLILNHMQYVKNLQNSHHILLTDLIIMYDRNFNNYIINTLPIIPNLHHLQYFPHNFLSHTI